MKRVVVVGGETHIAEVTGLRGKTIEMVGAAVRPDQVDWAKKTLRCPVVEDYQEAIDTYRPDIVAVANENDVKAEVIIAALESGCDVIADKPLAITEMRQEEIESVLKENPDRKLLNLLTLRGTSQWRSAYDQVQSGRIGRTAFVHVRMAVRMKRDQRPPWFLDYRRSGGLFPDLLIHGLDQVEWVTGHRICAVTANTGNLSDPNDENLHDHAAVFCELDNGSSALVEGQRLLPDTVGSDYRMTVAGTLGYLDLVHSPPAVTVTDPGGAHESITELPAAVSVVSDWLAGGSLVEQADSLRANRLAIIAAESAMNRERIVVCK